MESSGRAATCDVRDACPPDCDLGPVRLLASVTRDWAIGKNGNIIVPNPADLRRFKELTMGHTVLMGHRTFASLPGSRPLPQRRNIVLLRSPHTRIAGVEIAHSLKEAKQLLALPKDETWVIGGESVYRSFLSCASECWITMNHLERPDADTWFPNLNEHPAWELKKTTAGGVTPQGIAFDYLLYQRKPPRGAKVASC